MPTHIDLPAPRTHTPRCGPVARSRRTRFRAIALIGVHVIALIHIAHWRFSDSTLSPLEPSEAMQTLELGYVNAGFVLFLITILATAVLGRFFCGWACHVVAYQDASTEILGRIGLRPRAIRSRLLALIPLGAALYMFVWPQIARLLEGRAFPDLIAHFMTDAFWATFSGPGIATLTFLVDGFLIVYLLGPKAFCTYGCPYGAVFGATDRVSLGKIRVTDACEQCGHCTASCTSNVRVHEEVAIHGMVVDPGCMKCTDCVSVCPKDALYYSVGAPALGKRRTAKKKRHYDFTWPEEISMASVFLVALYAYRGLYELVPFLLALGLACITAFLSIVVWRVFRNATLELQGRPLRISGRMTKRGWLYVAITPIVFAFVVHSVAVQASAREGRRLLVKAEGLEAADQVPLLDASLAHLLRAERLGLIPVGTQHLQIGSIYRARGDIASAETHMLSAIEIDDSLITPRMELAEIWIRRGDLERAEHVLTEVIERRPDDERAQRWLGEVKRRRHP